MQLADLLDVRRLEELIADGFVAEARHPSLPLRVYDYTRRTQGQKAWEQVTELCRGLVVDDAGTVLARPFLRMPNVEELRGSLPQPGPFEATEKIDGSLVISLPDGGFVTRGSFVSTQAGLADTIWAERFGSVAVPAGQTWLFELVHPANRNIVDYGDRTDLVLLAAIDIETGFDVATTDWPGSRPARFAGLRSLEDVPSSRGEGYVLRLADGRRAKLKNAWFRRVEQTMNRTTERTVWKTISSGSTVDALVADAPAAFAEWVRSVEARLAAEFASIEQSSRDAVERGDPRSATHPEVAYKMSADQPYADRVWRIVRPTSPTGFRTMPVTCGDAPGLGLEPRT